MISTHSLWPLIHKENVGHHQDYQFRYKKFGFLHKEFGYDYKKKKWVKHIELRGSDYFGSNIVTYKNNAAYIKLKDLKPNTKYKFRVRLSVAEFDGNKPIPDVFGKTIKYSPWSNSKVITTKK